MPNQNAPELPSLSEILGGETEKHFIPVIPGNQHWFRLISNESEEAAKLLHSALSPREEGDRWNFGLEFPKLFGLSGRESDRVEAVSNRQSETTREYLRLIQQVARDKGQEPGEVYEWFQNYQNDDGVYAELVPYLERLTELNERLYLNNLAVRNAEVTVIFQERLGLQGWKKDHTLSLPEELLARVREYLENERSQWKDSPREEPPLATGNSSEGSSPESPSTSSGSTSTSSTGE